MKIAYLDCISGISGDMTLGALVDGGVPLEAIREAVASMEVPGLTLSQREVKKKGFRATKIDVHYEPEHEHRHLSDILDLIEKSRLTDPQKSLAGNIFRRLAEAEAKVHGTSIDQVHFHEVGAADSIADVVGSAVAWDLLGVDQVFSSPIPTGTGTVKIAHGTCSVPAPATAELLRGIPIAASDIPKELTTPTGAAIVAELAGEFGPIPPMKIERIGYGAGDRDLEQQPNILRLLVGEAVGAKDYLQTGESPMEDASVWVVETNIDDLSGELIGHCIQLLWKLNVLDVYATPIQMKKHRPATKLTVLCQEESLDEVEQLLFAETTTLGIRRWPVFRSVLQRKYETVFTPWGEVRGKIAVLPDGTTRFSPEYDSAKEIAIANKLPLCSVYEAVQRTYELREQSEDEDR
jgi:hypothetical protein